VTTETAPNPIQAAKALLQQGRFAEAATAAERIVAEQTAGPAQEEEDARDIEALYILAVARRYEKAPAAAQRALERLLERDPHFARAYQEQGHLSLSLGDTERARAAYQRAVALNPALPASWKALVSLHQTAGARDHAEGAAKMLRHFESLPPELISVTSFLHEGKLLKAERLCRGFLQQHPQHVEAMRLLAQLGVKLHVLDDAEFLLESAIAFQPDYLLARIDYVEVLQKRQKFEQAFAEAERLKAAHPDNPGLRTLYANAAMAIGRYEEAVEAFKGVLNTAPDRAGVYLSMGHALKTVGRREEAEAAYRSAYGYRPDYGDAFWSLANLKTYRFTADEIAQMEAREAAPTTTREDRYHLCFALGKAHEDAGDAERAFAYYERGNALKKAELRYSADRMHADLERQKAVCTQELFAAKAGMGHPAPDPIFIVGLPRAGSTLLEQILASHSQVDGTLELPNILAISHRLSGRRRIGDEPRYPAVLHDLSAEQLADLGKSYIEDTRIHREAAPFFTDKMPNNFRHIGLIKLILPNAKIIDIRRDPLACCFSGFKQLFAEGQEFTYGLTEIGRYYRDYVDLMAHWDRVLPGAVLRVSYEELVADLEPQVRRVLEYCALPFEPQVLDFHKTERSVRTASSEQVRRPVNTEGVDYWKKFEPYLGPLKEALGPELTGRGA